MKAIAIAIALAASAAYAQPSPKGDHEKAGHHAHVAHGHATQATHHSEEASKLLRQFLEGL